MPCVGGYTDGVAKLGMGNQRILSGQDANYGNKKVAVIQTSDSRSLSFAALGSAPAWIKWSTPIAEALRQACLSDKSRIALAEPVFPKARILSIQVSDSAFLGPLDPQVPSKDGTLVPAQALLTLLDKIQKEGDAALARKQNPPWALIRLLDQMDQKQLGAAISASNYVMTMAAQYLERYKFKTWQTHRSSGLEVTDQNRQRRALEVAGVLCSHDRWKAHGHAISRDVLWSEVRIQIDHPNAGLQRAMRRHWALLYYTFDKSPVVKLMVSSAYAFFRMQHMIAVEARP
jgi:hypothetical protein